MEAAQPHKILFWALALNSRRKVPSTPTFAVNFEPPGMLTNLRMAVCPPPTLLPSSVIVTGVAACSRLNIRPRLNVIVAPAPTACVRTSLVLSFHLWDNHHSNHPHPTPPTHLLHYRARRLF